MGTFAGGPKQFVTNVSVQMSHKFSTIMQQLMHEALEGKFDNKGEAVRRRDQLLAESKQAAPADSDARAVSELLAESKTQAEPAQLQFSQHEDRQVLAESADDIW